MNLFRKLFGKEERRPQPEKSQTLPITTVTSALLEAISEGDIKKANELIATTPNAINQTDDKGMTPLRVAVGMYRKELVNTLIQKGANIDPIDNRGYTPLHVASMHSESSYAQILIRNGANVNARTNSGRTPLHLVFLPEVATLLIQNGADVNAKDQNESSPLHSASEGGKSNIVGILLANGADVNSTDSNRQTPLHWAAWKSYPDIVRELLTNGADVNAKDIEGFSPLYWARKTGDDIDQILLKYGPGYNAKAEVVNLLIEFAGRQDASQVKDWKIICQQCKYEFGMPKDQKNKACPRCGRVASFEDAKLNPTFAELLFIAFQQDLKEMEAALRTRVHSAVQVEDRQIVRGWLELIADMLEASPACTSERKRLVRSVCDKLRQGFA